MTGASTGRPTGDGLRPDLAGDLLTFIAAAPSPFHAVAEMARRLAAAGFTVLDERRPWTLRPGGRYFVVRDGSSVVAFVPGSAPPPATGFRIIGAHTDSPTFKVRPQPDSQRSGYAMIGVEPYGSVLRHTWLDRDLTLAGRVALREGEAAVRTETLVLPGAWLRIPSLAIHLHRELNSDGLQLDPQRHLLPLWGAAETTADLHEALADHLAVPRAEVLAADLVTADTQPPARGGFDDAYLFAPRLDNLASCHAAVSALLRFQPGPATAVVIANDHEEVGSGSAEGARGSLLADVLSRVVVATQDGAAAIGQSLQVALARSRMVSADMAHAVHPNYPERHDPEHRPRLGGGPVVKHNANQAYATDADSAADFLARCADVGVVAQHFSSRADFACGSTIGPLTAARTGVATVDIGIPTLSMHSVREQCAAADVAPLVAVLTAHLQHSD